MIPDRAFIFWSALYFVLYFSRDFVHIVHVAVDIWHPLIVYVRCWVWHSYSSTVKLDTWKKELDVLMRRFFKKSGKLHPGPKHPMRRLANLKNAEMHSSYPIVVTIVNSICNVNSARPGQGFLSQHRLGVSDKPMNDDDSELTPNLWFADGSLLTEGILQDHVFLNKDLGLSGGGKADDVAGGIAQGASSYRVLAAGFKICVAASKPQL